MPTVRSRRWSVPGIPTVMLVAIFALAGFATTGAVTWARAQDDAELHPAHIHAGTCDQLGDVVAPLSDVGYGMMGGTPVAAGEMTGAGSAVPVKTSLTSVDMALEAIAEGGHAINIHESAENIDEYIACGDIGGQMMGDTLVIGLQELNDSNHAGVAVLEADGDSTTVTIYLIEQASREGDAAEGTEATPAAAAGEGAAQEVAVGIVDFAYDPNLVEIPVGGTITWTNQAPTPHTATARDRDLLQSGTLDQGESYSETFDEAGTFDYFCEFHANMKGTVVVR